MTITLPHVFQDGVNETASGVQVNEDLNVLKAAIEGIEGHAVQVAGGATGIHVASGSGTLTFTGGSQGKGGAILHGLGVVPKAVLLTLKEAGPGAPISMYASAIGSSSFEANGWSASTPTGTAAFSWLAIG